MAPEFALFRTTVWIYPFFSTRWHDAFGYGQMKTELKTRQISPAPLYFGALCRRHARYNRLYAQQSRDPQYLSETSFIFALGVATHTLARNDGWFEAGEAVKYLTSRTDVGAMIPDYRGGISYAKGFGHLLGGERGLFFETNDDGVFVSRFQNDMLLYSQNRAGYTFAPSESLAGLQAQLYWNFNGTVDRLRQYWANYVETGRACDSVSRTCPSRCCFR